MAGRQLRGIGGEEAVRALVKRAEFAGPARVIMSTSKCRMVARHDTFASRAQNRPTESCYPQAGLTEDEFLDLL